MDNETRLSLMLGINERLREAVIEAQPLHLDVLEAEALHLYLNAVRLSPGGGVPPHYVAGDIPQERRRREQEQAGRGWE